VTNTLDYFDESSMTILSYVPVSLANFLSSFFSNRLRRSTSFKDLIPSLRWTRSMWDTQQPFLLYAFLQI